MVRPGHPQGTREGFGGTIDSALPSPTVFGRSRRSEQAKTGPLPHTEVIEERKFPHSTGKIGSPKNKLPLPPLAPRKPRCASPSIRQYHAYCLA